MVGMAGMPMTQNSIRAQIASAVRLVLQLQRLRDGTRRVTSISEITGIEGDVIQLQEIMRFKRTGVEEDGRIRGEFRATGVRPTYMEDMETMGIRLDRSIFDPSRVLASC